MIIRAEALFVIVVLLVSFVLRLGILDGGANYHLNDTHRDMLVASRIGRYGEWPLRGPAGYMKNLIPASPLFFYITAGVLRIHDSIIALGVWQIVADLLFATCVYILARILFGWLAAILAFLVAALADSFLYLAILPWQHSIVPPILYLSYLMFALSYLKKKRVFLILGVLVFVFAIATSPSGVIAATPLVILFLYLLVRNRLFSQKDVTTACLAGVGAIFVLFFLPYLIRVFGGTVSTDVWQPWEAFFLWRHTRPPGSAPWERPLALFSFFLPQGAKTNALSFLFLIVSAASFGVHHLFVKETHTTRKHFRTFVGMIALALLISPVVWSATAFPYYFFVPVYGLALISGGHLVASFLQAKQLGLRLAGFVLLFLAAVFLFPSLPAVAGQTIQKYQDGRLFASRYVEDPALEAISSEIRQIYENESRESYDFFQFKTYFHDPLTDTYEEYLWDNEHFFLGLEERLGEKLTMIDDREDLGWRPIGLEDKPYLFLACKLDEQQERDLPFGGCLAVFASDYPQYVLKGRVFADHIHGIFLYGK